MGWQFLVNFFFRLGVAGAADKYHKHKQLLLIVCIISSCFMSAIWWVPSRHHSERFVETMPVFTCSKDAQNQTTITCGEENGTTVLTFEAKEYLEGPYDGDQSKNKGQNGLEESQNNSLVFCKSVQSKKFCSAAQNITNAPAKITVLFMNKNCTVDCTESTHRGILLDTTFWLVFWMWFGALNCFIALWPLLYGMNYDLLGDNKCHFGKQRVWGTYGSILIAVVSAFAMNDYSSEKIEINYIPCFVGYAALTVVTGIIGLFFKLEYKVKQPKMTKAVLKLFKQPQLCLLFCVIIVMGFLYGAMANFIFVFLRDMDASSWVFGGALFVRFASEAPTLYFAGTILKKLGYVNCVYLVLLLNIVVYVSTSFLANPWWELLLAALKSFTFSIGFMALSIHTSSITPPAMSATLQALVQSLHFGIGEQMSCFLSDRKLINFENLASVARLLFLKRAKYGFLLLFSGQYIGVMVFGAMIDAVGMRWSFRIGGIISLVTCALFALLHKLLPPYTPEAEAKAEAELEDVMEHLQSDQNGTMGHNRETTGGGKLRVEVEQ